MLTNLPGWPSPGSGSAQAAGPLTRRVFIPIASLERQCPTGPGRAYNQLSVSSPPTDRPAEVHADINLTLRGYVSNQSHAGLINAGVDADPKAPQLPGLFGDYRLPAFRTVYQVHDWDWSTNSRGSLLAHWSVSLAGFGVQPNEPIFLPPSGYDIGQGFQALVLYATRERITIKYTREDNVIWGYTLHVENLCVDPGLVSLYQTLNAQGRGNLPALRAGEPIGRAMTNELGVAIRDTGTFMDPRWRQDWWHGY